MTKHERQHARAIHAERQRMAQDETLRTVPQWVLRARYPMTMGATMERGKDYTNHQPGA
jgi:hypothetical protein